MLRAAATLFLSSVLLLALPTAAADTRQERSERFRRWRTELTAAERARSTGAPQEAEGIYRALLEEAQAAGEDGLPVARAHDGLADLYRTQHRCRDAVPHYRAAAAAWQRLLKGSQPRLAITLHHQGICLVELRSWEAAEQTLRQAAAVWLATEGEDAESLRQTLRALDAAREQRAIPWDAAPGD